MKSRLPTSQAQAPYLGELEQLILLATLQCGDEAYTVPIRMRLQQSGRSLARGALYTALDRLESKGLVRSWMSERDEVRGGHARRHFAVTGMGVEALRTARAVTRALSTGLDHLLEPQR